MSLKLVMLVVALMAVWSPPEVTASVTYDHRSIIINGQRRILISGSIHYPRSTPEMWPDLIQKAKDGGLDVIQTYVFWNGHEPSPGQYYFGGRYDLVRFIKLVKQAGLYVHLRVGPYACAEWNFGGFPVWLKYVPGISFRTDNGPFKAAMAKFTSKIVSMVKAEGLYESQGGPIILSQIENEYGPLEYYDGSSGKSYAYWAAKMAVGLNTGVPWVMCKQDDAPDPVINTCNGFYCDYFSPNKAYKPKMWTEAWTGWFTGFGGAVPHRPAEDLAFAVARFIQKGGSFINYYMYHGGTNFGRTAGGPFIATSYDYDAPIDEYGLLRQPKWGHLRDLHKAIKLCEPALVSSDPIVSALGHSQQSFVYRSKSSCAAFLANYEPQSYATVSFNGLHYNLPPWSISILPDCKTTVFNTAKIGAQSATMKMQWLGGFSWKSYTEDTESLNDKTFTKVGLLEQLNITWDRSDYLWYTTYVDIDHNEQFLKTERYPILNVMSAGHSLHVFINGQPSGSAYGGVDNPKLTYSGTAKLWAGSNKISLLSVSVGLTVVEMAPSNGRARKMKSVASLSRHSAVEPPVKQNFHLIHNVTVPTLPDVTVTPTASREHGPPISFTGAQSTEHNLEQNIAEANIVQNAQGSIGSKAAPDISRRITGAEAFLEQFGKKDASRELDPISFTGAQSTEHNLEQNTAEANVVQNAQGSMGSKAAPDISRRISGNMSNNLQTITLENDLVETNNIAQVCQGSTGTSSNVATSLSRKIYVLPSHLRSSRKSRSKYRQSANDEAPNNNEIGSTEPIIITSTLPEISSVFRRSRNRVLRSHNPASCRPKPGEDPFPIFWVAGAPVGDYAYKFANYCGEETKRYDKFPLHERWNETQANHARSIFRNAQIKKEYIFFGEEDPEHEGQRLPVDQRLAERFLVFTIQDIKKDWRSTIKKDYWEAWDIGDIETREAIENGLDSRIPLVQWPALCAYFGSSNKRVEAKRNSENRRSTKRPRLTCTLGRKKQIHAYYDMQKKEGPAFNIAKAFIKCHKTPGTEDQYPNEQTKEYCEQFDEVARDMPICTQSSFSVISTITDKVSGRHHGGYERGLGRAFSRKLHPAAEKSPIISMYSSKDEQIAALSNRIKELESKEVQRQQSASTPFMQSFSSASGTAVDIGAFMTYMTQFASQMNHFTTQIGVPLPPGVPNAEPRHNGSGSNGHGGDEDNRSFSMHAD